VGRELQWARKTFQ